MTDMNENTSKRIVRFHPEVEERFRKVTSRLDGLVEENKKLTSNLKIAKGEREALERQEIYVDDMPGKQLPFRYQINIPLIKKISNFFFVNIFFFNDFSHLSSFVIWLKW